MKKVVFISLFTIAVVISIVFALLRGYVYYKVRVVDKMEEVFYKYANMLPEDKIIENDKNRPKEKSLKIGDVCFENVFGDIEEVTSKDGAQSVKFKNGIAILNIDENLNHNENLDKIIEVVEKEYKNFQSPKYEAYKQVFNTCPNDLTIHSSAYFAHNFMDKLKFKEIMLSLSPLQSGESYYCIQSENYNGFQLGSFNKSDDKSKGKTSIIILHIFKDKKHFSLNIFSKNGQVDQQKIDKVLTTMYFKE